MEAMRKGFRSNGIGFNPSVVTASLETNAKHLPENASIRLPLKYQGAPKPTKTEAGRYIGTKYSIIQKVKIQIPPKSLVLKSDRLVSVGEIVKVKLKCSSPILTC